jgi:DNA-binding Lrp family transcriptional regulator
VAAVRVDELDLRLLELLREDARLPIVEVARRLGVARATAQARVERLIRRGALAPGNASVDLAALGFEVLAFVTLEIAQGRLEEVAAQLAAIPEVIEAHGVTGGGDVHCRVVCRTHGELQGVLLRLGQSPAVVRSSSVVALSELVHWRIGPVLETLARQERDARPRRDADAPFE